MKNPKNQKHGFDLFDQDITEKCKLFEDCELEQLNQMKGVGRIKKSQMKPLSVFVCLSELKFVN